MANVPSADMRGARMRGLRLVARAAVCGVLALTLAAVAVAPSTAAPAKPRGPVVKLPPKGVPIHEDDDAEVSVKGVSWQAPIYVDWGDPDEEASVLHSKCSLRTATAQPNLCTDYEFLPYYESGTYTITVRQRGKVLARQKVVYIADATAWTPPDDWAQPAGWKAMAAGATYRPCSTIPWYWDRTGEPADRVQLHEDIPAVLAMIAPHTGLTFVETDDRSAAGLVFDWKTEAGSTSPVSVSSRWNSNFATISLNPRSWWVNDQWRGFSRVTQPDGTSADGNGWLLVKSVLWALGMDNVDDAAQVMGPGYAKSALGAGDIDGLRTMYLNHPCTP